MEGKLGVAGAVMASEIVFASENRVGFSEGDDVFHEIMEIIVGLKACPVEPGGFVVLAVCVIVAGLGIAHLISGHAKNTYSLL